MFVGSPQPLQLTYDLIDLQKPAYVNKSRADLLDSDILNDQFVIGQINNHDILAIGYWFEDEVAEVVYLRAQKWGCSWFIAIGSQGSGSGVKFSSNPIKDFYTLFRIDAGNNAKQHAFGFACE